MHSKTKAKAKIIGLGLISGLMSAAAMAEPPIQPGDTLQSLSQVKITTTVNGQQGSIQELVASGQVRIADAAAQQASIALGEPAPANTAAAAPILSSSSAALVNAEAPTNSDSMSGAAPELPDANAAAEAAPETPVADTAIQASPEAPQAPAEAIAQ